MPLAYGLSPRQASIRFNRRVLLAFTSSLNPSQQRQRQQQHQQERSSPISSQQPASGYASFPAAPEQDSGDDGDSGMYCFLISRFC